MDGSCNNLKYPHWEKLRHQYKSVEDIDLYIGIAFEEILNGTMLGTVTICLWADHF
ncbi:hypothetical protein B4U80_14977 [Leptotrombidium deliense]|uniref:Uncharacterized protein n=1 Tax=Leptotrombidium deliense TaxID=299467 RepID=A0A443RWN3_9ACAR|nr:hypothetical protein B4U80_14977 [Leptotrombidium deliense]